MPQVRSFARRFKRSVARVLILRISRAGKGGREPLSGAQLRALNALRPEVPSAAIFASEHGDAFHSAGFAKMVKCAGIASGLNFKVHPHRLRHSCAAHLGPEDQPARIAGPPHVRALAARAQVVTISRL